MTTPAAPPSEPPEPTPPDSEVVPAPPVRVIVQWSLADQIWLTLLIPFFLLLIFLYNGGQVLLKYNFSAAASSLFSWPQFSVVALTYLIAVGGVCPLLILYMNKHRIEGFWTRGKYYLFVTGVPVLLGMGAWSIGIHMHWVRSQVYMGTNSMVIDAGHAYAKAQDEFFTQTQCYAPSLQMLSAFKKDDPRMEALASGESVNGIPYNGYLYRVLSRQSDNAPGGKFEYMQPGSRLMPKGHALVAWPRIWDETGRNTFLVGPDGVIYQKDWGPNTEKIAEAITEFDPTDYVRAE